MVMVTRAAAAGAANGAKSAVSEANAAAGPEQQLPQGSTHSAPLSSSKALKDQLKQWQTWSSCEVLLVAGLTTTQLDAAHKLIAKQYGAALVHETLTQADGTKVLRVMKAARCITAVLLALRAHSCTVPQEVVKQLLQPMRNDWAAIAAAHAEQARVQAEQRRLRRLRCISCGVKGDVRPLVFDDEEGLLCQMCLEAYADSEDFDDYKDWEFQDMPPDTWICDCDCDCDCG